MAQCSHLKRCARLLGHFHSRVGLASVRGLSTSSAQLGLTGRVSVVGAVTDLGQPRRGVERGPDDLRSAGLSQVISSAGWDHVDRGNICYARSDTRDTHQSSEMEIVLSGASKLADIVEESAASGDLVLTLGGDHSISMGSGAGALRHRPNLGMIWVDAHTDVNTPDTSPSGNIHGMPVAFLMGIVKPGLHGHNWLERTPRLTSEQIVYVGCRDIDASERAVLREHNLKVYTMHDIDKYGIGKVMEMALDHLGERPLHLSYDIDAFDPVYAASTGTPVRGGLTWREGHFVAEEVAASGRLVSMDVVEVNTLLQGTADADATLQLAVGIVVRD